MLTREQILEQIIEYDITSSKYKGIYNRVVKRLLDLFFSIILLICLLPLYMIIGIFIVIETGLPIFYRAKRGGYKGKPFMIYKFRSMICNADRIGGGTTALNDNRITKIGAFLRKSKIDETPQLLNIIKGEMSFVGIRPELLKYTERYSGDEKLILEVRPGITDFSSLELINLDEIIGEDDADFIYEKYILQTKNKLRIKYAVEVSLKTDLKLFFMTAYKTLRKIFITIANCNIAKYIRKKLTITKNYL